MNLLAGLEKFGINSERAQKAEKEMYEDPTKKAGKGSGKKDNESQTQPQSEFDYLFPKKVQCVVCTKEFYVKAVKNTKLKRLQPDFDLRPRYQDIDPMKYGVYCCPCCGYSAMGQFFGHLTKGQINLVREQICVNFVRSKEEEPDIFDLETAITRYKLALYCSIVKHARNSEKAYTCLRIAWLYRDLIKELPENAQEEKAKKAEAKEAYNEFYKEAFEGFQKAVASEDFPICGMDTYSMDYLLACMAFSFKQYSYASKSVQNILQSHTAERRIKDKALELKNYIVEQIRKESEEK